MRAGSNNRWRTLRNTLVSLVVLVVIIVAGFVGYTYYLGPDGSQPGGTPPPAAPPPATRPEPPRPMANAPVSAAVQSLASPVSAGSNSSLTVKTRPAADCKISVVYGDVPSTDSGLTPKKADEFGVVDWSWTVGADVQAGTYPVKVTCAYQEKSAAVQADLTVTAKP